VGNDLQADFETSKLRVIIVEDEVELRSVLVEILSRLGLDVRGVGDGASLDSALADYSTDIVVLDLNLPGEDGVDIAQRLRRTCNCGIVMTTSRAQISERVAGFQRGADLYFVKPIDPMELYAALLSLGRRLMGIPPGQPGNAFWRFNPRHSVLMTPGEISINLSARESIVMRLLLAVPGATVSRSGIFSALGDPDDEYADKRLETLLSRLRSKVHTLDPEAELPIRARHCMGYAFLADTQE